MAKVAPDATSLVYSTYLDDAYQAAGLAVLPNGNVWIAGNDVAAGYPTTPGGFQGSSAEGGGAFLTELNADGLTLVYSTVIGNASDTVAALAMEPDGDLWLAGKSSDAQFRNITPMPAARQLNPASGSADGADFTLTVNGNDFIPGSTVEWNGSPRLTTFIRFLPRRRPRPLPACCASRDSVQRWQAW